MTDHADVEIITGDVSEVLAELPDETFHAVLTDPPYGLGKLSTRQLYALLEAWLEGRNGEQTAGMLEREWDVIVCPRVWEEVRRVCRPGALIFAYSHSRTVHLQTLAMQVAGWQILPQFTRVHGQALAAGTDVANEVRKKDKTRAQHFQGYGTQVKNNTEPVVSAINPPEGLLSNNVLKYGCGGFNTDGSRIPPQTKEDADAYRKGCDNFTGKIWNRRSAYRPTATPKRAFYSEKGRYPSNVILEHPDEADSDFGIGDMMRFFRCSRGTQDERHAGASHFYWEVAEKHPDGLELITKPAYDALPERRRMKGNPHIAVKPLESGRYLSGLILQPDPDACLLVPYAGTGSEVIAALLAGWRRIIAVEMSEQWVKVARARIAWWQERIEEGCTGSALDILRKARKS